MKGSDNGMSASREVFVTLIEDLLNGVSWVYPENNISPHSPRR